MRDEPVRHRRSTGIPEKVQHRGNCFELVRVSVYNRMVELFSQLDDALAGCERRHLGLPLVCNKSVTDM
jgi:hypothetical protein